MRAIIPEHTVFTPMGAAELVKPKALLFRRPNIAIADRLGKGFDYFINRQLKVEWMLNVIFNLGLYTFVN